MKPADAASAPSMRLDVWLWAARFFKTRSLAKQAIEAGRVQVDGHASKAGRPIHVGSRLAIVRAAERFEVAVLALAERRGPAPEAQALYHEDAASVERRRVEREQARAARAGYTAPPVRPDKKGRRAIKQLEAGDKLPPWWPR